MTQSAASNDAGQFQSAAAAPNDYTTAARQQVDLLLRARGIKTVIYVDDGNPGADEDDIDLEAVIAALEDNEVTIEDLAGSEATAHLVREPSGDLMTAETLASRLQLHPEEFADVDLAALTDVVRVQRRTALAAGSEQGESETDAELSEPETTDLAALRELRDLIPDEDTVYRPINLAAWNAEKSAVLASSEPVLLLFDRDFSREGEGADAGEQLLIEAIRSSDNVYCGILTHRATSDQAEREIATKIADRGGDLVEIVVIAKQTVIDQPEAFPAKLKASILARQLRHFRDDLLKHYQEASTTAVGAVKDLDAYTLLQLVAAADHEGAHGAHNVMRVAATKHRLATQRALWTSRSIDTVLQEIRTIHEAGAPRNPLPPVDIAPLRREDRYDTGAYLADLHLPLEPGDIFEKVEPGVLLRGAKQQNRGKRYILLMQACDMVVRSDGRRTGDPLTMTLARLKPVADIKVRRFDHSLEWYDDASEGQVWCVHVLDRVQLPVRALDACVFSNDGGAVIDVGQSQPIGMTPGWRKRFADSQDWAGSCLGEYATLVNSQTPPNLEKIITQNLTGTSDQLVDLKAEVDPSGQKVAFGLRRIGRASNDDARVMLANVGNYTARPDREGDLFLEEEDTTA